MIQRQVNGNGLRIVAVTEVKLELGEKTGEFKSDYTENSIFRLD